MAKLVALRVSFTYEHNKAKGSWYITLSDGSDLSPHAVHQLAEIGFKLKGSFYLEGRL